MASQPTVLCKRAPDGTWEIPVLGDIGFFGVDGAELIRELASVKPTAVKFIIHSPGGLVYDAIAVAGYIQEKGITCYAEIYGTCMSAATVFAALAGPKRTAMAAGSMFLVHMPYGGDQKLIDNAAEYLVDLYMKSYGWTKAEARKHMTANNGDGVYWTAEEAKSLGVVDEVMKISLAAYHKQKLTAMAETKNTVKATVKLTVAQALSAVTGGTEVEVDVEQTTADALAEKDTRIAQLESELQAANEKAAGEAAQAEAITNAQQEAVQAKADLATANAAHETALAGLKAQHDLAIAEMKKPLAKATVADNQEGAVAAIPGVVAESPNVVALKSALRGTQALKN